MPFVSQELIEKTWKAVAVSSEQQILKMQRNHQKKQQALTHFTFSHLLDLREEAAGVGIYVYHVVLFAFSRVSPKPGRVKRVQIEQYIDAGILVEEYDPIAKIAESSEPHVLRYVYEALTEDEDEVVLSDTEQAEIFNTLNLVVSCLHDSCARA